jgi:hypothetical protein
MRDLASTSMQYFRGISIEMEIYKNCRTLNNSPIDRSPVSVPSSQRVAAVYPLSCKSNGCGGGGYGRDGIDFFFAMSREDFAGRDLLRILRETSVGARYVYTIGYAHIMALCTRWSMHTSWPRD